MKDQISQLLSEALQQALPDLPAPADIQVDRTRDPSHGDFASNIALVMAKPAGKPPREIAKLLQDHLPPSALVDRVEIAGPGFLNFFLHAEAQTSVLADILQAGEGFGTTPPGSGRKVIVEFVSANPTGPLHVGHGRGAAYGDCIAKLLVAAGHDVHREYYVNDAGRQMDILAVSTWLRYLQACGESIPYPANAYQGDYVTAVASELHADHQEALRRSATEVFADVPPDEAAGGDKEAHIDGVIENARKLLGDGYALVLQRILDAQLDDIRNDLTRFRVTYDQWYSERSLVDAGRVTEAVNQLREAGHTYEKEGALWFASERLGDDKDRVLLRSNGAHTYFAADIAYHLDKLGRGFDWMVDIWGADHHGYVPRVKKAVEALTGNPDALDVALVQFAVLYRGGEKLSMSTRSAQYVTLSELVEEVGVDAARYFYVMRSSEQHLDFDLELAKSQSNDNPVYYIQYAHARICRVLEQAQEREQAWDQSQGLASLGTLTESHEEALLKLLSGYPEIVASSARRLAPHTLAHYLRELADGLHSYYNAHVFLVDDAALRNARLTLVAATGQVIRNGLGLLGVSAPQSM